jgi:hypothetical protein
LVAGSSDTTPLLSTALPCHLAPQDGAHPGQQLRHLKGLDIVVGPAIQAAQAIIQTIASRDDEQGNRVVLGADAGQHLQPILAGQTQVE